VKTPYSHSEMELLLKKPDVRTCRFSEYRNWVIANYITATANRISTVINLRIHDLNFEDEEITLRTVKNKKQYIMPMSKYLKSVLIEYLSYRKGEPDDFVFCPENDSKKSLSEGGIKTAIAKYNRRRGVSKTSCHIIRNYFSLNYLLRRRATNGLDVYSWAQDTYYGPDKSGYLPGPRSRDVSRGAWVCRAWDTSKCKKPAADFSAPGFSLIFDVTSITHPNANVVRKIPLLLAVKQKGQSHQCYIFSLICAGAFDRKAFANTVDRTCF